MNTMFNFNQVMGLEEESTPAEAAANTKETSTFDKVVVGAAKVGVIAGATILTIAAVNSVLFILHLLIRFLIKVAARDKKEF